MADKFNTFTGTYRFEGSEWSIEKVAQHAGTNNKWLDRVELKQCGWLN